ncbi:MAG: hypothetical protein CL872_07380 [Dehalococcoidaceae bacterium]|nr:hypothetical protein [Dehalococcoidaceae bacterium]
MLQMDSEIITWIFLAIFGLFIFFKFKKFLPFKQDARSVNYYHTQNFPETKPRIIKEKEVRYVKSKKETEDDSVEEKEPEGDDPWFESLQRDADIANEMFGLGKKKYRGDDYW